MKNTKLLFSIFTFTLIFILSACAHTHNYTEWKTTAEATCTSDGQKERICRCGEKEVETIEAFGHQEVTLYNVPPSCTKWGAIERIECSVCQEIISENSFIKPIGHSYVDSKCENCDKNEIEQENCYHQGWQKYSIESAGNKEKSKMVQ